MKKLIILLMVPVLMLILGGCFAAGTSLEVGQAARIELRSGDDGKLVEVTDVEDVRHITDNVNTLRFEKVRTGKEYTGRRYSVSWYGPDGELMDEMLILGGNRVEYNGTYYDSIGATVDTAFLDRILEAG